MDETKAISPEIKGLFDTIREQAREFSRAFERFEALYPELEKYKNTFDNTLISLRSEFRDAVNENNANFMHYVDYVEKIAARVEKIYENLDEIEQLRESLLKFHANLKERTSELDKFISKAKNKLDIEIDEKQTGFQHKMEKKLESLVQKMEMRTGLRLKQLESRVLSYNQKLLSINESQAREYKQFADEIEDIRNDHAAVQHAFAKVRSEFKDQMEDSEEQFENAMQKFQAFLDEASLIRNELETNVYLKKNDFIRKFDELRNELSETKSKTEKLRRNTTAAYILSAIAITGFILMAVVVFLTSG